MGILLNVAAITEENISNLSPNTKIKLGLIFLKSFENLVTPIEKDLDIPISESSFSKIFTLELIFNLSLKISLKVSPCFELKCVPVIDK